MKNKKPSQAEPPSRRLDQEISKRRKQPSLERNLPHLSLKPTILIVCEGKNTEPSYFNHFRLSSATIRPVGEGYNTVSLVKRASQLAEESTYEQVWCVFDKDDFNANDFNAAIQMAQTNGFGVAYSNQSFEYWIILHFEDHQGGGMHRSQYNRKINSLLKPHRLGYDGDASKVITDKLFNLMEGIDMRTQKSRQQLAINRAKKGYGKHDHSNRSAEESTTTVFLLVEELLKYL